MKNQVDQNNLDNKIQKEKTNEIETADQEKNQTESLKYLNKISIQKVNNTQGSMFIDDKVNFDKKINDIIKDGSSRNQNSQNSNIANSVRVLPNSKIDKDKLFGNKKAKDKVTINLENINRNKTINLQEASLSENRTKGDKIHKKSTENTTASIKNRQDTHSSDTSKPKSLKNYSQLTNNKILGLQINSNSSRLVDANKSKKYESIQDTLKVKCQTQKNSSNQNKENNIKSQSGLANTYQTSQTPNAVSGMFMSSNQPKENSGMNEFITQAVPFNAKQFVNDKINNDKNKQKTYGKKDDVFSLSNPTSLKSSTVLKRDRLSDLQKPKLSSVSPMKNRVNNSKNLKIDVSENNNLVYSSDVTANQNSSQSNRQNINFKDTKPDNTTSLTNLNVSNKQNYVDKILNNKYNFNSIQQKLSNTTPGNGGSYKNIHLKDDQNKDINSGVETEKKEEKNQTERSLRESFKDHFNNKIGKFFLLLQIFLNYFLAFIYDFRSIIKK